MKNGKRTLAALLSITLLAGLALTGCGSKASGSDDKKAADSKGKIVVGSKDFTENLILAEVYSLGLEDAGYTVDRSFNISSSAVHTALKSGEIDMYPEYTGTGLISVLGEAPLTDAQQVYDKVKEEYKKKFDIDWLDYAEATDSQGLVITTKAAEKYNIKTISDLQKHAADLRFASQGEFDEREDGIPALEATYGAFDWKSSKIYDNGLKYQVLLNDEADVTPAYTTEGQLVDKKLTLLEDDKHVWPPYNIAPVVRGEVLEKYPEMADVLNAISAKLDTATLTKLNAKVDVDKEEYEDVAADYYDSIKDSL